MSEFDAYHDWSQRADRNRREISLLQAALDVRMRQHEFERSGWVERERVRMPTWPMRVADQCARFFDSTLFAAIAITSIVSVLVGVMLGWISS